MFDIIVVVSINERRLKKNQYVNDIKMNPAGSTLGPEN